LFDPGRNRAPERGFYNIGLFEIGHLLYERRAG
jgi:hypothetical protein